MLSSEHDTTTAEHEGSSANMGDDIQSHIGDRLRAYYDSVLNEPVPDKFLALLTQLDTNDDPHDGRE